MRTPEELLLLGRQVSRDFISKGKDMNESIEKVANALGLNEQEVKRVAEQANVDTYLNMVNKSSDRYVEFPLADPTKINAHEKTAESASTVSDTDYIDLASTDNIEFSLSMYNGIGEMLKVAELEEASTSIVEEEIKLARLEGTLQYVIDNANQEILKLAELADTCLYEEKQAILAGETPEEVFSIVKEAADLASEFLVDQHVSVLEKDLSNTDFSKVAACAPKGKKVNKKSKLYKAAEAVENQNKYIFEILALSDKYGKDLEKMAAAGAVAKGALGAIKRLFSAGGRGLGKIKGFYSKYPRLSSALTAASIAGPLSYEIGKTVGESKAVNGLTPEQAAVASAAAAEIKRRNW